jgi:hypothetical protein
MNSEGEDPGCFQYDDGAGEVLYPWNVETCAGTDCNEHGLLMYCKTINNLDSVADSLEIYFKPKVDGVNPPACCGATDGGILGWSLTGSINPDEICGFSEFDPDEGEISCPAKKYKKKTITYSFSSNQPGDPNPENFRSKYVTNTDYTLEFEYSKVEGECVCSSSVINATSTISNYELVSGVYCVSTERSISASSHPGCSLSGTNGLGGFNWSGTETTTTGFFDEEGACVIFIGPDEVPAGGPVDGSISWQEVDITPTSITKTYFLEHTNSEGVYKTDSHSYTEVLSEEVSYSEQLQNSLQGQICDEEICTSFEEDTTGCRYCCTDRGSGQSGLRFLDEPEGCIQPGSGTTTWLQNDDCDEEDHCDFGSNSQSSNITYYAKDLTPGTTYQVVGTLSTVTYTSNNTEDYCEASEAVESDVDLGTFVATDWAMVFSGKCGDCSVEYLICQLEDEANDYNEDNELSPGDPGFREVAVCQSGGYDVPVERHKYITFTGVRFCEQSTP